MGRVMVTSGDLKALAVSREDAEQAAATWIARRGAREWSPAEAAALEAWLAESASHRVAWYRLNAAWEEAGRLAAFTRRAEVSPEAIRSLPLASARSRGRFWALAASIVLALTVGGSWIYRDALFHPNRYATVVGGLESVPLADGSRVTLNTDSQMRVALSDSTRSVDLDRGEAYFEVAKDPTRPFVVNAGRKRVVAVGTQFSVFREGDDIRVTVAEGTVRLEDRAVSGAPTGQQSSGSAAGSGQLLLPAGSVARAQKDAVMVRNEGSAEIQQHMSWRSGLLTFRDTSLADAVTEFNRYNERKIVIEDPAIASLELGGVFRSTNIDPFIALLEQGFPVRAKEEGNRIVLTHN